MNLLLWGLQSPINIGMILRSAEVFQHTVIIYDEYKVLGSADNLEAVSDFACGAFQRRPPRVIGDIKQCLEEMRGSIIATAITPDALPAADHFWRPDDTVLIGNEYDGLPEQAERMSDTRLTIPMPGGRLPKPPSHSPIDAARVRSVDKNGTPNLNVAVAASILCFLAYAQSSEKRAL